MKGEYVNSAGCIILIWSDHNISLPVRYSILLEDNADIFAGFLLISNCSFSSLILSSVVMINLLRFFLKREELSHARAVSITKKIWFCSTLFIKIHKVLKVNNWWMIKRSLLNFSFVWNFHNKIVYILIKAREIFDFLPLINNSVTTGLSYLSPTISAIILLNTINIVPFLFGLYSSIFVYLQYHLSIQ